MLDIIHAGSIIAAWTEDNSFCEMLKTKPGKEKTVAIYKYKQAHAIFMVYFNLIIKHIDLNDPAAVLDALKRDRDILADYCDMHKGQNSDDVKISNVTLDYYKGLIDGLTDGDSLNA